MSTTVINSKNAPKGWREDPQYVYVGRMRNGRVARVVGQPGYFGNPYKIGQEVLDSGRYLDRAAAIYFFSEWAAYRLDKDPDYKAAVRALAGKTLVCHCKPEACHGDALARFADELAEAEAAGILDGKEER